MKQNEALRNPRVIVVQKLYAQELNKKSELTFSKHRYKKFIKDVVLGTLERKELIEETIQQHLSKDLSEKRTEKLLIVLLHAAIFEFLYRPQTSLNIIISEYLNTSDFFLELSQKNKFEIKVDFKDDIRLGTTVKFAIPNEGITIRCPEEICPVQASEIVSRPSQLLYVPGVNIFSLEPFLSFEELTPGQKRVKILEWSMDFLDPEYIFFMEFKNF